MRLYQRCAICHGPAFELLERPSPGDKMLPSKCRLLSGGEPVPHALILCGTCGERPFGAHVKIDIIEDAA